MKGVPFCSLVAMTGLESGDVRCSRGDGNRAVGLV